MLRMLATTVVVGLAILCVCLATRPLVCALGKAAPPRYASIVALSPLSGRMYVAQPRRDEKDAYVSTLSSEAGDRGRELLLRGKATALAVDRAETVLAVGMWPMAGPNEYGGVYLGSEPVVVIVDLPTFRTTATWPIRPSGMEILPKDRREVARFDEISISTDGTMVATYYWKPTMPQGWRSVVALWKLGTGEFIGEFQAPEAPPILKDEIHGEGASNITFSGDSRRLGVHLSWLPDDPLGPTVDGMVAVWQVPNENVAMFPTQGRACVFNLCLDESGRYLAGWDWGAVGTLWADLLIYDVQSGRLSASKRVGGRIMAIGWDRQQRAFVVRLKDGSIISEAPPSPASTEPAAKPTTRPAIGEHDMNPGR